MKEFNDFKAFDDRLTENARYSLERAGEIARALGSTYIGTEHILLGVLGQEGSIGARVLRNAGITFERAKLALSLTPKVMTSTSARGLSETAKLTLQLSMKIARDFGQERCGTEHVLFGVLSQKNARATILLRDMNADLDMVRSELEQYLSNQQFYYQERSRRNSSRQTKGETPTIDYFGVDLTAQARAGKLDPVVGRESQIKRVITILNRRVKNNPALIGEPGVGKTAIVEGLAQQIVAEDVPEPLLGKRIVMLDLSGVIAGTKYRGEFEDRLKRILEDLHNNNDIILFIDELHLIVGAGAAEGAIDAGNILKPALARGLIRVIGATTLDEYRKHIERDAALERRFQTVLVPEASGEETVEILKGLRKHYEGFHKVSISDEVIIETVKLGTRYLPDRYLPDKAIDILDEAAAEVRINKHGRASRPTKRLHAQLRQLNQEMDAAAEAENYELAARLKTQISILEDKLEQTKAKTAGKSKSLAIKTDDIAHVVASMTGVPVTKLLRSEVQQLVRLDKTLSRRIVGQSEAIAAIARSIRRNRSGIADIKRPIGSFLFMGPTGVGKTELAKVLAEELFNTKEALIKIDMSEFMERHNVSRLLGAPAGYIGYEEGGQLTEKVRRQPYSLILFDEVEKAHPDVFNMLLQIFEDGYLTDAKGRRVDFTNTVIIMTSNIGAENLQKEAALGFRIRESGNLSRLDSLHEDIKAKVFEDLKNTMRPELLNRIDQVIVFRALSLSDVGKILELRLNELTKRLSDKGLAIMPSSSAKRYLVEAGYDPNFGVRPLRRVLEEQIEGPIATGILEGRFTPGDTIKIGYQDKKLTFEVAHIKNPVA